MFCSALLCGGRGTPLYKPFRYVPHQGAWALSCFGLKWGKHFDYFGLQYSIGYVHWQQLGIMYYSENLFSHQLFSFIS